MKYDICIIGGGAAGFAAAVTAGGHGRSVIVIEKKEKCCAKVAASGNGRCNLSNINCDDWSKTSGFFSSIGLLMRSDSEGRIYPYSEDGRDVAECLLRAARSRGVKILTDAEVYSVSHSVGEVSGDAPGKASGETAGGAGASGASPEASGETFIVKTKRGEYEATKVLIASGGKAAPKLGTTGDGYRLAKSLGHSVTKLSPVLTAVETEHPVKRLSGVREKCDVRLYEDENLKFSERGEVQFTDYGLSGICVFNMSRFMDIPEGMALENGLTVYDIELDLAPDFSESDLARVLSQNASLAEGPGMMCSIVKKPLAEYIFETVCGGEGSASPESLAAALKALRFKPRKLRGWDHAEVTRGGVPLYEIDPQTMESIIVPGLYFAGEILDYDGQCGGYNLQHAWMTGIKAGRAMAE